MDEPAQTFPPPGARLSKTPSWITLGFVLGVLFVWALPRAEKTAAALSVRPPQRVQLERPKGTVIEAVFAEWGKEAVWENDLTEVALWDVDQQSYSICYEVLRNGENYYFRSIPRLTRPILTHGLHGQAPLLFTETETMRREWLDQRRFEFAPRSATPGNGRP